MLHRARLLLATAVFVFGSAAAHAGWHSVTFSLYDQSNGWYGKYGFAKNPFGGFNRIIDSISGDPTKQVVAFIEDQQPTSQEVLLIISGFSSDPGQSYFNNVAVDCVDQYRLYYPANAVYFYAAGHAFWKWNVSGPPCMNILNKSIYNVSVND